MGYQFMFEAADVMGKFKEEFDSAHKSKCLVHSPCCWSHPVKRGDLHISIAGISCLDWSSMGEMQGYFGKGGLVWLTLVWEYMKGVYDMGILECTHI